VPDVLVVPALELSDPVVLYILMEANDVSVNRCHTSRLRGHNQTNDLQFWNTNAADHEGAGQQKQQRQGMEGVARDAQRTEPEV